MGRYLDILNRPALVGNPQAAKTAPKDAPAMTGGTPRTLPEEAIEATYQFLNGNIIISPADSYPCPNRSTYRIEAPALYAGYGQWCYEKRIKPLTIELFREAVTRLLPHAKYHEKVYRFGEYVDEWTGFRFISDGGAHSGKRLTAEEEGEAIGEFAGGVALSDLHAPGRCRK